jgi:hypothetical protein
MLTVLVNPWKIASLIKNPLYSLIAIIVNVLDTGQANVVNLMGTNVTTVGRADIKQRIAGLRRRLKTTQRRKRQVDSK